MVYYADCNHPDLEYEVPEELECRFVNFMLDNGAAPVLIKEPSDDSELHLVKGVYQTPKRWGLDIEVIKTLDEDGDKLPLDEDDYAEINALLTGAKTTGIDLERELP